uniref:Uncharacterized protein n=1 Tax=Roseihalotalea indica TaxID=2867963 RepID=A0AA49GK60_9BACT|nr:hypothetical protein K4G66_25525 [Tunicatimonas sp. TK19036]
MIPGIIHFSYRKLIDSTTIGAWEKYVLKDTHREFYIQAEQLDPSGTYATFQEMAQNLPNADQLHEQVSTAAVNYIRQLEEKIPDVVNMLGKRCMPFRQFQFEILQSHIRDIQQHRVAIHFYSEPMTWLATVDRHLLLASGDQTKALRQGETVDTDKEHLPILS